MAPFIATAIPYLIEAAPSLFRLFGDGAQSEKNAKVAETVVGIAKTITNQTTVEGAVTALQQQPSLAQDFAKAIESNWYTLVSEAGGGGIAGAREFSAKMTPPDKPWMSPALWVTFALLPLVYIALYAVLFNAGFSDDIRAMVLGSIFGGLLTGGVTAFWFGTSASSQRKTELMNR